ncbi:MAG TPA: cytochrome c maturation protein CcmE [Thermoanaerobaculia bacterium]|jgi:cytochrome c-type biogenesis protein CcmE|nr:cytochrome c maturation protein CcmE [Thermoanaerobaculia bacterium]
MKKNRLYLFGGLLLLAFAGFSFTTFKDSMTPYVSYQQARQGDRIVQVAGALEKGSYSYAEAKESLYFTLKDPKTHENLRVRFKGLKPGNFEDAISIVAIGRYDDKAQEFEAQKLLVKCPSKYQGAEVKTYS